MPSRILLENSVLNSGKTRHYRSKDFTTVPRLDRSVQPRYERRVRMSRPARWEILFRFLRLG